MVRIGGFVILVLYAKKLLKYKKYHLAILRFCASPSVSFITFVARLPSHKS
jgi:hypothetical protein